MNTFFCLRQRPSTSNRVQIPAVILLCWRLSGGENASERESIFFVFVMSKPFVTGRRVSHACKRAARTSHRGRARTRADFAYLFRTHVHECVHTSPQKTRPYYRRRLASPKTTAIIVENAGRHVVCMTKRDENGFGGIPRVHNVRVRRRIDADRGGGMTNENRRRTRFLNRRRCRCSR